MCRGINGQIDKYLSRNASLSRPKNPADGRRLNVTVTGYFGVQRERPRARSRAAKMKRERASPGRPATQPDAPLSEVRAKRVLGNNNNKKKKRISFNNASRSTVKIPDSDILSSKDLVCFQTVKFTSRITQGPLFIRQGNASECDTFTVMSQ